MNSSLGSSKNAKTLNIQGLIWSLGCVLALGFSGFIDKIGSGKMSNPLWYSLITLISAVFVSFLYMKFIKKVPIAKIIKSHKSFLWILVILGINSSGIFILLRFYGLKDSTATFVTLSQIITSVLTVFFASIVFKEYLPPVFKYLFPIILLATYFFSTGKIQFIAMKHGDLLVLLAALLLAMGNMFGKTASKHFDASVVTVGRVFWGFIFVLVSIILTGSYSIVLNNVLLFPVLSGIITAVNFICYYEGIKRCGVGFTTSLLIISPLITKALSLLFLSEKINTIQTISFIIILIFGYAIIHSAFYEKSDVSV